MNFRAIILAFSWCMALIALQGCGKAKTEPAARADTPQEIASNTPAAPDPAPDASAPTEPKPAKPVPGDASGSEKSIARVLMDNAKSIKSPFKPNPQNTVGWQKSGLSPNQLATKVDGAMAKLKGVYGEAVLYVKNKQIEGSNKTTFKIKDRSTYTIQYLLPAIPTILNRLVADGGKRAVWENGKWQPQKAETTGLGAFPSAFPRKIFSGLTANSLEWTALLRDLTKPSAGYKTVIEEKTSTASGRTFRYIRVVATKGDQSTLEARFDAKRFVPVTIRLTQKDKSGFETQVQWQAQWSFDNKFQAKDFKFVQGQG